MFVLRRQFASRVQILWYTNNIEFDLGESIDQPAADETDGKMCDINADPTPIQFLRRMNGRATTAERVKNKITLIGGGSNDSLKKRQRFLGRVTESFLSLGVKWWDIIPKILHRLTNNLIQIQL